MKYVVMLSSTTGLGLEASRGHFYVLDLDLAVVGLGFGLCLVIFMETLKDFNSREHYLLTVCNLLSVTECTAVVELSCLLNYIHTTFIHQQMVELSVPDLLIV